MHCHIASPEGYGVRLLDIGEVGLGLFGGDAASGADPPDTEPTADEPTATTEAAPDVPEPDETADATDETAAAEPDTADAAAADLSTWLLRWLLRWLLAESLP